MSIPTVADILPLDTFDYSGVTYGLPEVHHDYGRLLDERNRELGIVRTQLAVTQGALRFLCRQLDEIADTLRKTGSDSMADWCQSVADEGRVDLP